MRCDTAVYLQKVTPGEYNEITGNYEGETITETQVYADVTDTKTEMLKLVYGDIRQGSLTIRLLNHYNAAFDRIRVGSCIYKVDYFRRLRTKHVFIVSEVQ